MSDEVAYWQCFEAQEACYWEARRQQMNLNDKQVGDLLRIAAPILKKKWEEETMPNGYEKMHNVGVRADTLESVAGLDDREFRMELGYALGHTDSDNPAELRWLVALAARRIEELNAAKPPGKPWCTCGVKTPQPMFHKLGCPAREGCGDASPAR